MNYFLLLTIILGAALVFVPFSSNRKKGLIKPNQAAEKAAAPSRLEMPAHASVRARRGVEAQAHA